MPDTSSLLAVESSHSGKESSNRVRSSGIELGLDFQIFLIYLGVAVSLVFWYFSLVTTYDFMDSTRYQNAIEEVDRLEYEYGRQTEDPAGQYWIDCAKQQLTSLRTSSLGENDWNKMEMGPQKVYLMVTGGVICFSVEHFHISVGNAAFIPVILGFMPLLFMTNFLLKWLIKIYTSL